MYLDSPGMALHEDQWHQLPPQKKESLPVTSVKSFYLHAVGGWHAMFTTEVRVLHSFVPSALAQLSAVLGALTMSRT
jgi:hypothetical protein